MTHEDLEDLAEQYAYSSEGGVTKKYEYVFHSPDWKPMWECQVNSGFVMHLDKWHPPPNRFYRLMQRLILGFKWRKL